MDPFAWQVLRAFLVVGAHTRSTDDDVINTEEEMLLMAFAGARYVLWPAEMPCAVLVKLARLVPTIGEIAMRPDMLWINAHGAAVAHESFTFGNLTARLPELPNVHTLQFSGAIPITQTRVIAVQIENAGIRTLRDRVFVHPDTHRPVPQMGLLLEAMNHNTTLHEVSIRGPIDMDTLITLARLPLKCPEINTLSLEGDMTFDADRALFDTTARSIAWVQRLLLPVRKTSWTTRARVLQLLDRLGGHANLKYITFSDNAAPGVVDTGVNFVEHVAQCLRRLPNVVSMLMQDTGAHLQPPDGSQLFAAINSCFSLTTITYTNRTATAVHAYALPAILAEIPTHCPRIYNLTLKLPADPTMRALARRATETANANRDSRSTQMPAITTKQELEHLLQTVKQQPNLCVYEIADTGIDAFTYASWLLEKVPSVHALVLRIVAGGAQGLELLRVALVRHARRLCVVIDFTKKTPSLAFLRALQTLPRNAPFLVECTIISSETAPANAAYRGAVDAIQALVAANNERIQSTTGLDIHFQPSTVVQVAGLRQAVGVLSYKWLSEGPDRFHGMLSNLPNLTRVSLKEEPYNGTGPTYGTFLASACIFISQLNRITALRFECHTTTNEFFAGFVNLLRTKPTITALTIWESAAGTDGVSFFDMAAQLVAAVPALQVLRVTCHGNGHTTAGADRLTVAMLNASELHTFDFTNEDRLFDARIAEMLQLVPKRRMRFRDYTLKLADEPILQRYAAQAAAQAAQNIERARHPLLYGQDPP